MPVSTLLDGKTPPNLVVETPNFIMLRNSVSQELGRSPARVAWVGSTMPGPPLGSLSGMSHHWGAGNIKRHLH